MIFPSRCYQPGVKWSKEWEAAHARAMIRDAPLRRIFHHYLTWEEVPAGMWRDITQEEKRILLPKAHPEK